MGTFTAFPELPTELRLQVWEHVIGDEAPKRKVRVDDFAFSIIPDPSLISPLLSACPESRRVALSYYCDPVPIHAFKLPECGPRRTGDALKDLELWRDLQDGIRLSIATMLDRVSPKDPPRYKPYHAERQGRRTGTLHVSLAADTFVDGGRELSWQVLNPKDSGYFLTTSVERPRFITPVLEDAQYNQAIRTMNDNRIPLESSLQPQAWVRRRLAPRHPA
ncbi:hypothetical protein PG996_009417 [Apiospora saccharicola]|uniref:2EXR domain-containing protein n=1 Tax=Apiospora saccharicola TaxID=335842 RepID=A0ABR1UKQ2_9PEZI